MTWDKTIFEEEQNKLTITITSFLWTFPDGYTYDFGDIPTTLTRKDDRSLVLISEYPQEIPYSHRSGHPDKTGRILVSASKYFCEFFPDSLWFRSCDVFGKGITVQPKVGSPSSWPDLWVKQTCTKQEDGTFTMTTDFGGSTPEGAPSSHFTLADIAGLKSQVKKLSGQMINYGLPPDLVDEVYAFLINTDFEAMASEEANLADEDMRAFIQLMGDFYNITEATIKVEGFVQEFLETPLLSAEKLLFGTDILAVDGYTSAELKFEGIAYTDLAFMFLPMNYQQILPKYSPTSFHLDFSVNNWWPGEVVDIIIAEESGQEVSEQETFDILTKGQPLEMGLTELSVESPGLGLSAKGRLSANDTWHDDYRLEALIRGLATLQEDWLAANTDPDLGQEVDAVLQMFMAYGLSQAGGIHSYAVTQGPSGQLLINDVPFGVGMHH